MVDVGANTGSYALLVTQLPFLTVHSFEPAPSTYALLKETLELNVPLFKEHSLAKIYNLAASDATAESALCAATDGSRDSVENFVPTGSAYKGGEAGEGRLISTATQGQCPSSMTLTKIITI